MQHLQPNTTLQGGKYRIERVLGQGGFGITYLAHNNVLDVNVAIKEFFMKDDNIRNGCVVSMPNTTKTELFINQKEKFKKEAQRLRKLDNPHIVRVHDLFEENGTAYYVMDYIEGENLSERLKRTGQPMKEEEVRQLLPQILDALKAVHDTSIWHLDLKPANIMVDKNGQVKLIDFGASKQLNAQKGGATTSTAISYTNGYAPREQMEQNYEKFGPWTDIYALGATLYNLLTSKHPPLPTDIDDDMSEDKHLALPMFNVSDKMKQLVLLMMKTDRLSRPSSVQEINREYANTPKPQAQPETTIVTPTENEPQEAPKPDPVQPKKSRISLVPMLVFLLIFCGIGGAVYYYIMNKGTDIEQVSSNISVETSGVTTPNVDNPKFEEGVSEKEENHEVKQDKTAIVSENYAGKKFYCNIHVKDGILKLTGEGGKDSKTISCNPDIDPEIIIAEIKGLVYWEISHDLIWEMAEEKQLYIWDLHVGAKDALGKCVSSLSKARGNCPNAYKKAQEIYKELIDAENGGGDALWEEIGTLSFAMGEYPLDVCDIYD